MIMERGVIFNGADDLSDFVDEFVLICPGYCLCYITEFIIYCCCMLNWSEFWEYAMLWKEVEGT